ncbi:hypothetical protein GGR54DRAFT_587876 [Hypoxylon sp. NC1633]|nr:hypothetical protein GGR54DRAFT_587876 [Hypoxylon sp. NC1633]
MRHYSLLQDLLCLPRLADALPLFDFCAWLITYMGCIDSHVLFYVTDVIWMDWAPFFIHRYSRISKTTYGCNTSGIDNDPPGTTYT